MKKIFSTLLMVSALAAILLTGCEPNKKGGSFTSKITGIGPATVDITFTAPDGAISYAVITEEAMAEAPSDEIIIFATAAETPIAAGENVANISGLKALTEYVAYFAFKTATGFYGEVFPVNFTTTDYTDVLTITNIEHKGFSMHLELTEEMIANGHVLRYAFSDFAYYNMIRNDYPAPTPDASFLITNDHLTYGGIPVINYTEESADFVFNDSNLYLLDGNGNIIYDDIDPENPSPVQLHREMVPGEPTVIYVGEYEYGDGPYVDEGYYCPLFDSEAYNADVDQAVLRTDIDESIYWTGFYEKRIIVTNPPTVLDTEIEVEVETQATTGVIRITPGEGVVKYCIWIMDNAMYQLLLERYLLGHDEYMQWLTTSYTAWEQWGMYPVMNGEPVEINLNSISMTGVAPETDYHAFIVGIGDDSGISQVFKHVEFSTPAKVLPEPKLVVTPVESEDPYSVTFNVKAPQKDIEYIKYVANYEKDFTELLDAGLTFNDIVGNFGAFVDRSYEEGAAIIYMINSDEGCDFTFSSRDDATTIFAIHGYNAEDTYNVIKGANDPAVGYCTTPLNVGTKVESELFDLLEGDWTATYKTAVVNTNGTITPDADSIVTNKISIYNGITCPESLTEEDYKVYAANGINKEQADQLYEEFKAELKTYNEKVRAKNRLSCIGLEVGDLEVLDPYQLFVSPDAGRATLESLFWAFGPKWFLEIAEDGTVSVPMSFSKLFPATAWQYPSDFYVCGVNTGSYIYENDKNDGYFYFPVEISDDRNTITIKPISIEGEKDPYYMTFGYNFEGTTNWSFPNNRVVNTEIVLTKGWNGSSSASTFSTESKINTLPAQNYVEVERLTPELRRTHLGEPVKYQKIDYQIVTADRF